jgi:putative transposase
MARPKRFYQDGLAYHVINRGNKRARIFLESEDYDDFLDAMAGAAEHVEIRLMTFCLMPNHWHLVIWPFEGRDVSAYMQHLMNRHIRTYQKRHKTSGTGHVYQGRFKSFPIEGEDHFLAVCRYVEANPLRAGLIDRAEEWPWSGLACGATREGTPLLSTWPVPRPADWRQRVNRPLEERSLEPIREAIRRTARRPKSAGPEIVAETAL